MLLKLQQSLRHINNVLLIPIFCCIVLSLIGFSGTIPTTFNLLACGLFLSEWIIGLCLAEDKKRFLVSPYNLADLFSSIPVSPTFLGARAIRAIRVVKLISLAIRAKKVRKKIYNALIAAIVIMASMMTGAIVLAEVEPQSFEAGANYWEVFQVLVTGEFANEPETLAGRLAGSIVMILGVVLFGYSAGFASSVLDGDTDDRILEEIRLAREETRALNEKIEALLANKSDH